MRDRKLVGELANKGSCPRAARTPWRRRWRARSSARTLSGAIWRPAPR